MQIVSWGEQEIAHALAQHPALPIEGLERLAQLLLLLLNRGRSHYDAQIAGIALANNLNTPLAALRAMLVHPRDQLSPPPCPCAPSPRCADMTARRS